MQRFRYDLGLFVHLHALVTDGAFVESESESESVDRVPVQWLAAPAATEHDLTKVLGTVHRRLGRVADDDDDTDHALAGCVQFSLDAQRVGAPPAAPRPREVSAFGMSLHASLLPVHRAQAYQAGLVSGASPSQLDLLAAPPPETAGARSTSPPREPARTASRALDRSPVVLIRSRLGSMSEPAVFIRDAVKASLFVSPDDHGLTLHELVELGARRDLRRGELEDALRGGTAHVQPGSDGRYRLAYANMTDLAMFVGTLEGDPRSIDAFDFIWRTFYELNREYGAGRARITESVLLARGADAGIPEHDLRVALAIYRTFARVKQDGEVLHGFGTSGDGPKAEAARPRMRRNMNAGAAALMAEVRDLVLRRSDGRPASPEPVPGFASRLDELNASRLKVWWNAIASEVRRANEQEAPTSVIVLAAALLEAALCSVIERANAHGVTMPNLRAADDPKNWKLQTLVKEAKKGSQPIFDGDVGGRGERLNDLRQRIHAGRFWMSGVPSGGFDLRPEEAREARETLDRCLRAILVWLDGHPAAP